MCPNTPTTPAPPRVGLGPWEGRLSCHLYGNEAHSPAPPPEQSQTPSAPLCGLDWALVNRCVRKLKSCAARHLLKTTGQSSTLHMRPKCRANNVQEQSQGSQGVGEAGDTEGADPPGVEGWPLWAPQGELLPGRDQSAAAVMKSGPRTHACHDRLGAPPIKQTHCSRGAQYEQTHRIPASDRLPCTYFTQ